MPAIFTFAAYSDTGKTTYLEKLIPCLKRAGARVAVIKHDAHDFQLDVEGKDSWRFARAGADAVALASAAKFALWEQHSVEMEEIVKYFPNMDLILTEGYKYGPYPKIGIYRRDSGKELAVAPEDCFAVVTDTELGVACPEFPLDDPRPLADYLLDTIHGKIHDAAFHQKGRTDHGSLT